VGGGPGSVLGRKRLDTLGRPAIHQIYLDCSADFDKSDLEDMTSENQIRLAQRMLTRPPASCSWDDMLNHQEDLIWHTQFRPPHDGELRCCIDSVGLTLAFLALPPAEWQQLEHEFGAAAVAFRFKVLPADVDAFINVTLTARQVRLYADGPVLPTPPPVDPFEAVLQFVEAAVTKAAAAIEGKVRVRPLLSKNASLELLVITSTIATRDRLHQLPAFREALESMRGQLLREKIALRRVAIEAQEVIDRIDHLITAEDILRKGEAPQLRFDQGAWDVIRQLWPFGTR
jgi:hypothetical protein